MLFPVLIILDWLQKLETKIKNDVKMIKFRPNFMFFIKIVLKNKAEMKVNKKVFSALEKDLVKACCAKTMKARKNVHKKNEKNQHGCWFMADFDTDFSFSNFNFTNFGVFNFFEKSQNRDISKKK